MHVKVITPDETLYEGDAQSVTLPGEDGMFQVLDNHAPLVGIVTRGSLKVLKNNGEEENIVVNRGFVEVLNNNLTVLV